MKNKKSSNNTSLTIDSETKADDHTISNHFNNFYTSVAKSFVNKIPKTSKSFDSYLQNSNENSFFSSLTTEEDVEDILSALKVLTQVVFFIGYLSRNFKTSQANPYL